MTPIYVNVTATSWRHYLVKLDAEEYPDRESQNAAAIEAVEEEDEFDEIETRGLEVQDPRNPETVEARHIRHYGKDSVIEWIKEKDEEE